MTRSQLKLIAPTKETQHCPTHFRAGLSRIGMATSLGKNRYWLVQHYKGTACHFYHYHKNNFWCSYLKKLFKFITWISRTERKEIWIYTFPPVYLREKNTLSTQALATNPEYNWEYNDQAVIFVSPGPLPKTLVFSSLTVSIGVRNSQSPRFWWLLYRLYVKYNLIFPYMPHSCGFTNVKTNWEIIISSNTFDEYIRSYSMYSV